MNKQPAHGLECTLNQLEKREGHTPPMCYVRNQGGKCSSTRQALYQPLFIMYRLAVCNINPSESLDLEITARKKYVGNLIVSEFGGASDALLVVDLFDHIKLTQSHFEILLHAVYATSFVLTLPN